MSRARDGLATDSLSTSATATDDERTTPLGVKLCCAVGVLVWLDHVTFLTDVAATGGIPPVAAFVAFGTVYSCLLYGLWTRLRWSWGWAMIWFTLIGAFSMAAFQRGRAFVCFVLLASLKNVAHVFRDPRGVR